MSEDNSGDLQKNEHSDDNPDDVSSLQSAVEKLSGSKPKAVTEMMAMMGVGPAPNPIHQKLEKSHITQILALAADHDEREFTLRQEAQASDSNSRWWKNVFIFAAFLIVMAFVFFVFYMFEDRPEILVPTLTGLGGLVSGFVGGFGIGRRSGAYRQQ